MISLPDVIKYKNNQLDDRNKRLLIIAEGFEPRSAYWIKNLEAKQLFLDTIIIRYIPKRKSLLKELIPEVNKRTKNKYQEIKFRTFYPADFEENIIERFDNLSFYDEIVIDISVMSKMLIMIIFNALKKNNGKLRIIYSEPLDYLPSKKDYEESKNISRNAVVLPSSGVHDIVRTPLLSSVVMQRSPALVLAFLSFNEQLIRALLSELNPTNLFLINGVPTHHLWREQAMQEMHQSVIDEFPSDNLLDDEKRLKYRTSTLYYIETFELLAKIYQEYCYSRRIIIAPTGSKMQALGCSLIKICCPDIHIEYPTPESFIVKNFSSVEIREVHEVVFEDYKTELQSIAEKYRLNG